MAPAPARTAPEKPVSELATRPIEAPATPSATTDPRKASEARKAGTLAPAKPGVVRPALAPSGRPSIFPRK